VHVPFRETSSYFLAIYIDSTDDRSLQHYTPSLSTPRLTTSAIISKSYLICTVVVHVSVIAGVLELPLEKLRITGPKARNSELRGLKIKPPRQNLEKLAFQTLYSLVKEQRP